MALLDIVIDVSDAQGHIHWDDVADAGIKVAMIKATEGATFTAHTWAANQAAAAAAGIVVIPYHFMTNAPADAQADHFHKVAGLTAGAAYALDWERRVADGVDITAGATQVDAVGRALTAFVGRSPLGYWGIPGNTPGAPTTFMLTWDRWVPRFRVGSISDFTRMPGHFTSPFGPPGSSPPGLPFRFWQYTDAGIVSGVGHVDRSVTSFDNADALIAWCTTAPAAPAA